MNVEVRRTLSSFGIVNSAATEITEENERFTTENRIVNM